MQTPEVIEAVLRSLTADDERAIVFAFMLWSNTHGVNDTLRAIERVRLEYEASQRRAGRSARHGVLSCSGTAARPPIQSCR
jgi:hypothetical protein